MPVTQLSDLIVPEVFNPYMQQMSYEANALVDSGIVEVREDESIVNFLTGGGDTVEMPFYNDLTDTEANVSSDDPSTTSSPQKITTGQATMIRQSKNQSWSSMDLNAALAGNDPLMAIGNLVNGYWRRQDQRSLLASLKGIVADNEANDSGDMVHDISIDTTDALTDENRISGAAVVTAEQTAGDAQGMFTGIAMHSVVYAQLRQNDLIEFIRESESNAMIPFYQGKRVFVDDLCPAVMGVNKIAYDTFLFAMGAFGFREGMPQTPTEVFRAPDSGNGGGQEFLYNRREYILHPPGFKWTSDTMAGKSPTHAELENAVNWDRVYDRKGIRLAVLRTNG